MRSIACFGVLLAACTADNPDYGKASTVEAPRMGFFDPVGLDGGGGDGGDGEAVDLCSEDQGGGGDLAIPQDMAIPQDLAAARDTAIAQDLAAARDTAIAQDLAQFDMSTAADLVQLGDQARGPALVIAGVGAQFLADVQRNLQATGAFGLVDTIDVSGGTPTVAQLQRYEAVLVFSALAGFADPVAMGDNLARYFDQGGRVVLAPNATLRNNGVPSQLRGMFGTPANGYLFMDAGNGERTTESIGVVNEPQSPLLAGVKQLLAFDVVARNNGAVINGGVVVAAFRNGTPLVVRGVVKGRNRADVNLLPPSTNGMAQFWAGDGANLLRNALLFK